METRAAVFIVALNRCSYVFSWVLFADLAFYRVAAIVYRSEDNLSILHFLKYSEWILSLFLNKPDTLLVVYANVVVPGPLLSF